MRTVLAVLVVMVLAQQTVIVAQNAPEPTPGTWDEVKALQPGDELTLKLRDGRSIKGKLVYVREAELAVKGGKGDTALSREEIFQIYRHVPKSRKKAMTIGALAGGGFGVISGASADGAGDLSQPASTLFSGAVFAGAGALIGWALGGGKKRVLIYQAQR